MHVVSGAINEVVRFEFEVEFEFTSVEREQRCLVFISTTSNPSKVHPNFRFTAWIAFFCPFCDGPPGNGDIAIRVHK